MRSLHHFLLFISLFVLVACSSTRVLKREAAAPFQLSSYKTFGFYEVEASGDSVSSEVYHTGIAALRKNIALQLERRGLRQVADQPDLLVNIGIVNKERVQTRQTDFMTDAPRYMGQRRYSWQSREVPVGRYNEGTVSVHLVDRVKQQMLWEGVVADVIPNKPTQLEKQVAAAMETLFKGL
ncbi:DUF4136 domain-containing protein [Chitinophaga pendula]|uniref:DUF4136 domain-containing protein n=1 Tax=Chitinophaga TaxID=79328 RepID=UPI000BAFE2C3|nr:MULTISPECIES: DUF4136 domain-containing protein [Chitinophaga]ASZ10083.1 hypothetical protein CK934_03365 [Chitinophaga sp. MD30]UCJ06963.1 DUF4136 domain-containing protein [Chitinophaga pendula]